MRLSDKIAINASAQVVVQIVSTLTGVIGLGVTTRYLSVNQFGQIQAAFALITTFQFMSDLGLSTVGARMLSRAEVGHEAQITKALFTASFFFTLILVTAAGGIAVASYHGDRALAREACLILLAPLLLTPWGTVASAHVIWRQQVWKTSIITLVARLASVAGLILAAEFKLSALLVSVAYMLGYGIQSVGIIWWKRSIIPVFTLALSERVRGIVLAGLSLSVITVINAIYIRLDAFLLSILSSPRSVALYAIAYRVVDTLSVLPGYVMVTLLPAIAQSDARSERTTRIVSQTLMSMWLFVLPVAAGAVVAPEVTAALGGGRYRAAGVVLAILLPSIVMGALNSVMGNVMVAQARQAILLYVSLANLVINGGLNVLLIPRLGAEGAALALVATEIVSLAATVVLYLRGADRISLPRFGRSVVAGAACAGAMCVRFALPRQGDIGLSLVGPVVLGVLVYMVAVKLLGVLPEPLDDLISRLRARAGAWRAESA